MQNHEDMRTFSIRLERLLEKHPSFQTNGKNACKYGLERIRQMCSRMGEPQNAYPSIHIAGTNGKGSCSNMLASQLVSCGKKVGLYTSPHLFDFRERMRIVSPEGVRLISQAQVIEFLDRWEAAADSLGLSFFELTTAMAFEFFRNENVDIAVLETGLGGRLDATNVVTPLLSVITNIGFDHTDILGNTLAEIAAEKAGIICENVPVVIGEALPETAAVFEKVAREKNAPLLYAEKEIPELPITHADCDLPGIYQDKNIRTVLCAIKTLGMAPDLNAIRNAAKVCDFGGRWQKVCDAPLCICDIGHNEHGLKYNFRQLEEMLERGECSDVVMVYGSVADKDVDAVLKLLPSKAHLFACNADSPRAMKSSEIISRLRNLRPEIEAIDGGSVPDAMKMALEVSATLKKPLVYIGGSTYVVSEAVPVMKNLTSR